MIETHARKSKDGRLYVVLFRDGIKVGRSITAKKRIQDFSGIKKRFISTPFRDTKKGEKTLIRIARNVCGSPMKGREYFYGEEKHFDRIVSALAVVQRKDDEGTSLENDRDRLSPEVMGYLSALKSFGIIHPTAPDGEVADWIVSLLNKVDIGLLKTEDVQKKIAERFASSLFLGGTSQ